MNPGRKKKVLFVDDEPAFLQMMQRLAGQYCLGSWEVFTAGGVGQALGLLQSQSLDLVVLDVQMPVVDGVQFLALLSRKFPHVQKVVLTGYANEQYRTECLARGAELFLEKPRTVDGFEVVFATLNELARWKPEAGFRGVLRQVGIQDVLQMECLSRHSTILEVSAGGLKGEIYIQDGELVHAQLGSREGQEAFNRIIAFPGGEFRLKAFVPPPGRTLEGQWEFLLMEACRQRDEAAEAAANLGQDALGGVAMEEASVAVAQDEAVAMQPRPAGEATGAGAIPLAYPASTPPPAARPRTRVEEVLVCSEQGEVLYEYKCLDPNERINLLEFLSQRSRQIAQALAAGKLDRVEFEGSKGRMVAQFQNGCGVLVRANRC